jgi:hypothetical protein
VVAREGIPFYPKSRFDGSSRLHLSWIVEMVERLCRGSIVVVVVTISSAMACSSFAIAHSIGPVVG